MQRQSLGSPATKQPAAEEEGGDGKKKYKKKIGGSGLVELEEAREEIGDSDKSLRRSSIGAAVSAGLERSIHVIPLLTLFCFLVLYICSHDPAVTDLQNLGDLSNLLASAEVSSGMEIDPVGGIQRNLKELDRMRGDDGSKMLGRRGLNI